MLINNRELGLLLLLHSSLLEDQVTNYYFIKIFVDHYDAAHPHVAKITIMHNVGIFAKDATAGH